MSFQDLDFKSDRARLKTSRTGAPATPAFHPGLPVKLLLVATAVMLLGFSVSNWQPSAKAANSTPKSARLHYSLPLPAPATPLQQEIAETAGELDTELWESVTVKSGDTLASISDQIRWLDSFDLGHALARRDGPRRTTRRNDGRGWRVIASYPSLQSWDSRRCR